MCLLVMCLTLLFFQIRHYFRWNLGYLEAHVMFEMFNHLLSSWIRMHWSVFSWDIFSFKRVSVLSTELGNIWHQLMWYYRRPPFFYAPPISSIQGRKMSDWSIRSFMLWQNSDDVVLPFLSTSFNTNPLLFLQPLFHLHQQNRQLFKFTRGGGKHMKQFLHHLIPQKLLTFLLLLMKVHVSANPHIALLILSLMTTY